jgi:hypothetical protein
MGFKNITQLGERLDICTFSARIQEVESNPELKARLQARSKELDNSTSPQIKASWDKVSHLAWKLLTLNTAGWFFLIVPMALPFFCLHAIHEKAKAMLSLPSPNMGQDQSDTGQFHATV